jgi:hypothetical protein
VVNEDVVALDLMMIETVVNLLMSVVDHLDVVTSFH